MSAPAENCPTCGGALKQRGSRSVCPRCLLAGTVEESHSEISAGEAPVRLDAPPVSDLAGAFPDFKIVRLVGAGGMGIVYEAKQKALERSVALKLLRLDSVNPEFAERFQREAKTLAKLDHPNIVRIIDQGEREGWVFIIMEYVDGTDLSRLLDAGKLEPGSALEIADSLCAALDYAHDNGVVHRDIKPANILIDNDGTVKIADFGLAKLVAHEEQNFTLTTGGSSMGTPLYMAPEQRKSSADTDARADIYSAGVVLYEMLTGELPMGRVRPPSEIASTPKAIDGVVLKAIETAPDARFGSASAMRRALGAALAPRSSKRKRAIATLVGAAIVLGGSAMIAERGGNAGETPAAPEPLPIFSAEDALQLTANSPAEKRYFAAIISAGGDILAATDYKANPFFPIARESGAAYVFQVAQDGTAGAPVVLTSRNPRAGDLYGNNVAVSPSGTWLAVSAPNHEPDEAQKDRLFGAIEVYRRSDLAGNDWELDETIFTPKGFGSGLFRLRISISDNALLAVGSPAQDERGALLLFRRSGDGSWKADADLRPGDEYAKSGFGYVSNLADGEKEVLVSAFTFGAPEGNGRAGRVVPYRYDEAAATWIASAALVDPEPDKEDFFGTDIVTIGDQLIISAPGNPTAAVFAEGRVLLFEKAENQPSGWSPQREIRYPDPEVIHAAFGFRIAGDADLFAASALLGKVDEGGHSDVTIYRPTATDTRDWKPVATVSGKPTKDIWLGRLVVGSHFFAISHPRANVGAIESAGAILLFPKDLFPQANPGNN